MFKAPSSAATAAATVGFAGAQDSPSAPLMTFDQDEIYELLSAHRVDEIPLDEFRRRCRMENNAEEYVRQADMQALDVDAILAQQNPLTFATKARRALFALLSAATGVGLFVAICNLRYVEYGRIAIATSRFDAPPRIVGPGVVFLESIFNDITEFSVDSEMIAPLPRLRDGDRTADGRDPSPFSIVRVPPGFYGRATINARPLIMMPGVHIIRDVTFRYMGRSEMSAAHVAVGVMHVLNVTAGTVVTATVDGVGRIFEEGVHMVASGRFVYDGIFPLTATHIRSATRHRVLIQRGKIGLAFDGGRPVLLDAGRVHMVDSPTFEFVGERALTDSVIVHGALKIVTVLSGYAGVAFCSGAIRILTPGRHVLENPSDMYGGQINLAQKTLQIRRMESMSADSVAITFDGAVTIQVVDPAKAVTLLAQYNGQGPFSEEKLHASLLDRCSLTLSTVVGSNPFCSTFRAGSVPAGSLDADCDATEHTTEATAVLAPSAAQQMCATATAATPAVNFASATSFRRVIHDNFMRAFSSSLERDCGVRVVDMAVENLSLKNHDLDTALAAGAVAQTRCTQALIMREVKSLEAQAERSAATIAAEGAAAVVRIQAEAEAARIRTVQGTQADVEATRIRNINAALHESAEITRQVELLRVAGAALSGAKSSVVIAPSMNDVLAQLMMNGGGARSGVGAAV